MNATAEQPEKTDAQKKEEVAKALAELWDALKSAVKDYLKKQEWPDLRPNLDKALKEAKPEEIANARTNLEALAGWFPWAVMPKRLLAHLLIRYTDDVPAAEKVVQEILKLDGNDAVARELVGAIEDKMQGEAP